MKKLTAVVFVLALVGAQPVRAQTKPITVNLGAGATVPVSGIGDYFKTGYNVDFGVTFNADEYLGIQVEYGYNGLGQKGNGFTLPTEDGGTLQLDLRHRMQYGDVNLVFHQASRSAAKLYLLAGVGVYRRTVELTTPGVGSVVICNPWWYVCYPGFVPVTQVVGSRSSTDFGINFGGGVTIPIGRTSTFYVEARYHYMYGPKVENPVSGATEKANGQYFPITFGFRF